MQNFVSNAIRYSETGGVIVAARKRGSSIRLEVYDSGIGIPADKLTTIFREFERLGQGTETGIGLGLAIVERSAPLVGGTVHVRSRPGHGSCFAITLPSFPEIPSQPLSPTMRRMTSYQTPRRLLVVDDDAANRDAMRAVLESLGHDCITAADEPGALACTGQIDGALIDFHLGSQRDGIDLIDELRVELPQLPVVLVTADRSKAMLERARERNIAVLAKPLASSTLDQWIADQTGKPV